jgi:hypothetical protein
MAAAVAFIAANSGWISAAMSVVSGLSSIAQGQQQADSYRFQAQMATLQAQEKSLNYKREELNASRQANSVLERLQRANSAVVARASAMNIMPFSGSPLNLQAYNNTQGGNEWEVANSNKDLMALGGKNALMMGDMQSQQLNSAADQAESAGWMKGLMSFGGAALGYAKLGGAGDAANSMSSIDRVNSFDDGSMMRFGR